MSENGQVHEIPENERPRDEGEDIAAEFAELGRKLRNAIHTAWQSEERYRLENDIREGLNRFAKEVDEAAHTVRESELGQRMEASADKVRKDVESGKVGEEVRKGLLTALRSVSQALDKMSESFTPAEGEEPPKK